MSGAASHQLGFPASVARTLGFWDDCIFYRFGLLRTKWLILEISYPLWWFPKTIFLARGSHGGLILGMLQSGVLFWWRWRHIHRFWHNHLSYRICSLRCLSTSWCVNSLIFLGLAAEGGVRRSSLELMFCSQNVFPCCRWLMLWNLLATTFGNQESCHCLRSCQLLRNRCFLTTSCFQKSQLRPLWTRWLPAAGHPSTGRLEAI